ncbi:MAG: protein phosphatase 2C domain-containing protein [Pseudomonadales bacterium]|nr:protein phosphatase 2C domain-containing protein [Pseudomonadales bacterium]
MHQFGAGSHVGNVRDNNEDSYVCDAEKKLWIVADGMGGLGFGEAASAISAYTVRTLIRQGHGINQAIELAHVNIKDYAKEQTKGTNMGTTLVLLLSTGSLYNIFWVGDSRAYLLDETLSQLTTDHSLVQALIDQGELTPEEAATDPRKNAVTRALGVQEIDTVRADSISNNWRPGQKILLCSDGLSDYVSHQNIEKILLDKTSEQGKVDALIDLALKNGSRDNITAILISAPDSVNRIQSGETVTREYGDATYVPFEPPPPK